MGSVTLKGTTLSTNGDLPANGSIAPEFTLVKTDLSEINSNDLKGQTVILNIFPSIDTDVCAASVRKFNQEAAALKDTNVLCVSMDLPFAQARFCGAEGLDKVVPASDFRDGSFARSYGIRIEDAPLTGLMARAVVVIDKEGKVSYTQLVPEIATEPDYEAALKAASAIM